MSGHVRPCQAMSGMTAEPRDRQLGFYRFCECAKEENGGMIAAGEKVSERLLAPLSFCLLDSRRKETPRINPALASLPLKTQFRPVRKMRAV